MRDILFKAKSENTDGIKGGCGFSEFFFDRLQKVDSNMKIEDITDMIAEYDTEKKGYNRGLQDVWELAKKVSHMCLDDINKCFDLEELDKFGGDKMLYEHYTPQEALAKLQAYEKEQAEIKVGDVVRFKKHPSCEVLITAVSRGLNGVHLKTGEFGRKGEVHSDICKDYIEKTGKHIDIESLLGQIAE